MDDRPMRIRTYPARIPVTRERMLPNVGRISISKNEILILHGAGRERFKRSDWRLFIEDTRQVQDEEVWSNEIWDEELGGMVSGYVNRTLFLMKGTEFDQPTSCRVIEDEKIIFCGEKPEKMGYL